MAKEYRARTIKDHPGYLFLEVRRYWWLGWETLSAETVKDGNITTAKANLFLEAKRHSEQGEDKVFNFGTLP